MGTGLHQIQDIIQRTNDIRKALHDYNFSPDSIKDPGRLFSMKEAESLVGRSYQSIRDAENDGRLPAPIKGKNNRRVGFTLSDLNRARDLFGTRPGRQENEEPVILALQNLKGGVAKSTLSVHLAEYLAMRGYRVLLIDTDPQASCTQTFGYIPDEQVAEESTLAPFLRGEQQTLEYAVRKTYWEGLDIVPSNMFLHNVEIEMAGDIGPHTFEQLKIGVQTVSHNYDVVLIDPAPSMGFLSLNVLYAVNSLIIPTPPVMYDFYSTISFMNVLAENMEKLETYVGEIEYNFVRIAITRYDETKAAHSTLAELLQDVFGHYVLNTRMKESAEIVSAANMQHTVYELNKPMTSYKTYKRCINFLDAMNAEIEILIRRCWPSHQQALRHAAVI
jgi:chromosome partitioning protein